MKKKLVYTTVLVFCTALVAVSFFMKNKSVQPEPQPEVISRVEPAATPALTPTPEVIPIDFKEWKAVNEDVYAWINIPNTNIDYPVLQSNEEEDSDYYLEYTIEHVRKRPGAIYSEKEFNSKSFRDPVVILYGHDMWTNDTYFHQLHLFEKQAFFDENREVIIYTPGEAIHYTIFGVVNFDDRHLMASYNGFAADSDKLDFLNDCLQYKNSIYDIELMEEAAQDDRHILILSTCNRIAEDQRYLVLAMRNEE